MNKQGILDLIEKEIEQAVRQEQRADEKARSYKEHHEQIVKEGGKLTRHAGWKEGYYSGLSSGQANSIMRLEKLKDELSALFYD